MIQKLRDPEGFLVLQAMKARELPQDVRQEGKLSCVSQPVLPRNHVGQGLSDAQNGPLVVYAAFQSNLFQDVMYTGKIWHRKNLMEECIIKDLCPRLCQEEPGDLS